MPLQGIIPLEKASDYVSAIKPGMIRASAYPGFEGLNLYTKPRKFSIFVRNEYFNVILTNGLLKH